MLSLQNSKENLFFTKDTHMIHLFLTLTYELIPTSQIGFKDWLLLYVRNHVPCLPLCI